ncbi:MAG: hemerythrin domain-containing protein [Pyrinomonadaceae bacterium]
MTLYSESAARADACAGMGTAEEQVARLLEAARRREAQIAEPCRLDTVPLTKLIGYVIDKHHVYARRQVAVIRALLASLSEAQAESDTGLSRVRDLFRNLRQELLFHMEKEEVSIFPRIIRAETEVGPRERQAPPEQDPMWDAVGMLLHEHDELCGLLDEMRAATNDYTPPSGGSEHHRALYQALRELEADLLEHIHLEDSRLFPRALGRQSHGRA